MEKISKKEGLVKYKLIYTIILLIVYIIGKNVPLYMVDISLYVNKYVDTEALLMQSITGDLYQCSVFALGISPYIISAIFVQIYIALKKSDDMFKLAPSRRNHISIGLTLLFSIIQAVMRVQELQYRVTGTELLVAKCISAIEMVAGVMIIIWLINRNKKYGIGGQTVFIFINILEGVISIIKDVDLGTLAIPCMIALYLIVIMLIMENSEFRIPLQRISVHNIFADKNYLAVKINPIGVMPAMFSTALFMLPQLLVKLLYWIFPGNDVLKYLQDNLLLSKPLGIIVYILILYGMSFAFSRLFISPKDITEQFLKSGDSIVNLHAGKDTRKYLSRIINVLAFFSATILSVCLGIPMILQISGDISGALTTFPTSVLILTGMWCNLNREIEAVRNLEAYEPFI